MFKSFAFLSLFICVTAFAAAHLHEFDKDGMSEYGNLPYVRIFNEPGCKGEFVEHQCDNSICMPLTANSSLLVSNFLKDLLDKKEILFLLLK